MRITNNLENLTARRGLYCVWEPAREGKPTPLVMRWIDPRAESRSDKGTNLSPEEAARLWRRIGSAA